MWGWQNNGEAAAKAQSSPRPSVCATNLRALHSPPSPSASPRTYPSSTRTQPKLSKLHPFRLPISWFLRRRCLLVVRLLSHYYCWVPRRARFFAFFFKIGRKRPDEADSDQDDAMSEDSDEEWEDADHSDGVSVVRACV